MKQFREYSQIVEDVRRDLADKSETEVAYAIGDAWVQLQKAAFAFKDRDVDPLGNVTPADPKTDMAIGVLQARALHYAAHVHAGLERKVLASMPCECSRCERLKVAASWYASCPLGTDPLTVRLAFVATLRAAKALAIANKPAFADLPQLQPSAN